MKIDITNHLPLTILVTNSKLAGGVCPLVSIVSDAVDAGMNVIQMREKELDIKSQLLLAKQLRQITEGRALLFVNTRSEVVRKVNTDGIHFPESEINDIASMPEYRKDIYIGCSVHKVQSAKSAISSGANLLVAGTIFSSTSHENVPPVGVRFIEQLTKNTSIPVIGIGGIKPINAGQVIRSGAAGVAVVSEIIQARDPKISAVELVKVVEESWAMKNISYD